jgi:hypothetical protein
MTRFRWLGRETQHGEAASSPNRLLAAFFCFNRRDRSRI